MTKQNNPAVLGVGNALVDVISVLKDDSVLDQFGLPRGSMTLVDAAQSKVIYDATYSKESELATGGSVANTMRSMANLGGNAGYVGKIGNDELGELFKNDFERAGVKTQLLYSKSDTGRVMGLVSPDSERTMATYLGAAAEMVPAEFTPNIFEGFEYVYIEGYLVFNQDLIAACAKAAKTAGVKIAIDLSSFNVVEANLDFLKNLIKNYVDIVFANEEEAKSFTGLEPEEALYEISKDCEITIVKVGKSGSMIKQGDEVIKVGIIPAKALDTTGAGDAYAAGFFYGLTMGYNLQVCGRIAALVSGKVVEVMGPNLPESQWVEVKNEIEKILAESN
ncbi:adenosine kinase [Prolixibacteraceae bacterium Z1-6]|uniref:Adenosine kinase n=1 Tax=Draconibacterium aestuarii TaxID=2998507 RepID=A0A9X3F6V2_9BACT|nr:adenosine kinase [Prolixibacteraceae bacterium Z1-6]